MSETIALSALIANHKYATEQVAKALAEYNRLKEVAEHHYIELHEALKPLPAGTLIGIGDKVYLLRRDSYSTTLVEEQVILRCD